jgi:hypothetical protein
MDPLANLGRNDRCWCWNRANTRTATDGCTRRPLPVSRLATRTANTASGCRRRPPWPALPCINRAPAFPWSYRLVFAIRDLSGVAIVRSDIDRYAPGTAQVAGGSLVLVAATWPMWNTPELKVLDIVALALPSGTRRYRPVSWRVDHEGPHPGRRTGPVLGLAPHARPGRPHPGTWFRCWSSSASLGRAAPAGRAHDRLR